MQSILALTVAFLASTIFAAPTSRDVTTTVQFTNDQSGRNADVNIPINVGAVGVKGLLDNTALDVNDTYFVTSFFLQANFQGVECELTIGSSVITVDDQKTFAQIASQPVDLASAVIYCHPLT
ncbi:hypothetical protein BP5796_12923 [Coleophoma crateriformis]|uniref:Ubiquitin 3 binding protein But2 C-terminal domain-containing protein n=1 Tax=Coleophoma crateriformis TaxID=565419 RepID=A0A3D8Q4V1_9HELO|nr:hypothetical protein BP5796_12923 [Coleophoma crateriformis]